ncbi:MAG TPA: hypothetical protein VFC73_02815 [Syntrophomonadaceae bacterium]|nr:hypothetical protein [Syntrophomonadaceae bacterium]
MTKNIAFNIVNDNTTIDENRHYFPVTASEAYNLGLSMEKMLGEIYNSLENNCQGTDLKELLKKLVKQNEKDVVEIYEGFEYALNSEIGEFYRAGGVVDETIDPEIEQSKLLIMRNLENFFRKTEKIQEEIQDLENNSLEAYFNTKNSNEAYKASEDFRNTSIELYERLAKLYPEGLIRDAFEHITQVMVNGGKNLAKHIS